jgi:hypothetical protein
MRVRYEHFEVVTIETDRPGQLLNVTKTRQVVRISCWIEKL